MSKWHIPFRARGGEPSARRAWGREGDRRAARAVQRLRAPATRSAPAGPGPGTRGAERVRACGSALECVRPGRTVQLFPRGSLCFLAPSSLSLSPWLINNKKRKGEKGFQKKLIAERRYVSGLSPRTGYVRLPFQFPCTSSPNWEGRGGGKAACFSPDSVLFSVSFPHTCPAAAVIKAPSVISNAPRSPAAAPQRN